MDKVRPHLFGFKKVLHRNGWKAEDYPSSSFSKELTAMFAGVFMVYAALFGTGFWIYGQIVEGLMATVVFVITAGIIFRLKSKVF